MAQNAPPRISPEPTLGDEGLARNTVQSGEAAAVPNKIVTPLPLSATERDLALGSIDRHLADEVARLKDKIKNILPDELAILTKTSGWTPEKQNALLVALRAGDPAAVFEAWNQGNPQDTAGAEIVARQTDVKRIMGLLDQSVQNKASIAQNLSDLEAALNKVATSTPAANEALTQVATIKTWAEVRRIVENATVATGAVVKLPPGNVTLIYDPSLAQGKAIVLGPTAVMIGSQGHGTLVIKTGSAAEALGLHAVTVHPVDDAEGQEVADGVLLVNPKDSKATIQYNVNGNHYVMEPGMAQRLPGAGPWVVDYDRGAGLGANTYSVADGTYYFTPTDKGWQLYKQRFDVVIDNNDNPQEFHFLFRGRNITVPANGSVPLASPYPIVIRFDRGNGTTLATKSMRFSGNVEVGVNPTDNLWDVFPTTENQRQVTTMKLFQ
jgi:hypothetical protein